MSHNTNNSFVNMAKFALLGAILGILAGYFLGLLIFALQYFGINLTIEDAMRSYDTHLWPAASIPTGLGSAFGAIIGSIFGAITGLRSNSK